MTKLDVSVRTAINEEAKRFYETAKPLERWTLTNVGVVLLRVKEHDEAQSINEIIVQNYAEHLDEDNIAGMPDSH